MYPKLDIDQIRNSILVGDIISEEYLNEYVKEFLKLLKITDKQPIIIEY